MSMSRQKISGSFIWRNEDLLMFVCKSQSGSVLVITLLVLIAVTILGVASINTGIVELEIAKNEKEVRKIFYLAEGAGMEGIQRLIDTSEIDLNEQFQFWHHTKRSESEELVNFRKAAYWDVDGIGEDNGMQSPMDPDTYIAAVEWKVATGGSLVQTDSRLYQNRVYGLCAKYNAYTIVEIGYYLRY